MKELFNREGVFYEVKVERVKIRENDEIIHRQERPTELWWTLKEALKGKRVRVVVYELEGEE
ncbi:hypothetical protein [Palaeococcus ferrophilus]|uniref:hypothetical protein n=1 Tax=Palaeococcus ferrophilus TaxID=83868 RepID=UPI00064E8228|nr:hypothetical protein [Palaeococcus ferrophilus]